METIKIHIFHTGQVCVSPYLPFGGDKCNIIKASGITTKKSNWIWLPVSAYLVEHPKGKILIDCGWNRNMSPNGIFDKKAQIKSLGLILYHINQGMIEKNAAIDEQLNSLGIKPEDLDYVLLTHLDCDHVNGLHLVKNAKRILVSDDELTTVNKKSLIIKIRFNKKWWKNTKIQGFDWNDTEGPFEKSYDVFGDGSLKMINIPGHCEGLCAVKVKNNDGKYVLLFSDGGYSEKSWKDMITSGICMDKSKQKISLEWIRKQSLDENCIESLANHDTEIKPHIIEL